MSVDDFEETFEQRRSGGASDGMPHWMRSVAYYACNARGDAAASKVVAQNAKNGDGHPALRRVTCAAKLANGQMLDIDIGFDESRGYVMANGEWKRKPIVAERSIQFELGGSQLTVSRSTGRLQIVLVGDSSGSPLAEGQCEAGKRTQRKF